MKKMDKFKGNFCTLWINILWGLQNWAYHISTNRKLFFFGIGKCGNFLLHELNSCRGHYSREETIRGITVVANFDVHSKEFPEGWTYHAISWRITTKISSKQMTSTETLSIFSMSGEIDTHLYLHAPKIYEFVLFRLIFGTSNWHSLLLLIWFISDKVFNENERLSPNLLCISFFRRPWKK